jgi:RNA polymerase sigma factor (TIGR02999 family)
MRVIPYLPLIPSKLRVRTWPGPTVNSGSRTQELQLQVTKPHTGGGIPGRTNASGPYDRIVLTVGLERPGDITALLCAWSQGDTGALERLVPLVDGELRRLASICLQKEPPDRSLDTTALVNEAWLRLIDGKRVVWHDRAHFVALSAQLIRRILVDHARARRSAKRGAGVQPIRLDEARITAAERATDFVAIDDALEALTRIDPRKGRVVELRFFGGLSIRETAEVLNVSEETVLRDWRLARAWLLRELSGQNAHGWRGVAAD